MLNPFLNNPLTHILGFSIALLALIISALLIVKLSKKYEQIEIFWIPFCLVIAFVLGNKFI
jgi:hypothetical protein